MSGEQVDGTVDLGLWPYSALGSGTHPLKCLVFLMSRSTAHSRVPANGPHLAQKPPDVPSLLPGLWKSLLLQTQHFTHPTSAQKEWPAGQLVTWDGVTHREWEA